MKISELLLFKELTMEFKLMKIKIHKKKEKKFKI